MLKLLVLYQLHLFVEFLDGIEDAPGFQWLGLIHLLPSKLIENILFIQFNCENSKWFPQNMIRNLSLCPIISSLFTHKVKCTLILSRHFSNRLTSWNLWVTIRVINSTFLSLLLSWIPWLRVFDMFTFLFHLCLLLVFVELVTIEDVVQAHDERLNWFAMDNLWVWHNKNTMVFKYFFLHYVILRYNNRAFAFLKLSTFFRGQSAGLLIGRHSSIFLEVDTAFTLIDCYIWL